jgi:hypothetical protein
MFWLKQDAHQTLPNGGTARNNVLACEQVGASGEESRSLLSLGSHTKQAWHGCANAIYFVDSFVHRVRYC